MGHTDERSECRRIKDDFMEVVEKMKKAVKYFEGEHDFAAFKASGTSSKSSVRTIYKAEVLEDGERIKIELTRKWLFI